MYTAVLAMVSNLLVNSRAGHCELTHGSGMHEPPHARVAAAEDTSFWPSHCDLHYNRMG